MKNILITLSALHGARRRFAVATLCIFTAVMLILAGSCNCGGWFSNCLKDDGDWLSGTQWKLEYIVDFTGGSYERVKLAPQDCDTCFTLTFDAEKKWYISGVSILNTFSIQFSSYISTEVMDILVTDMDEPFDGNLYCSLIRLVTGINASYLDLSLFIKDEDIIGSNSYYLTYKRINL